MTEPNAHEPAPLTDGDGTPVPGRSLRVVPDPDGEHVAAARLSFLGGEAVSGAVVREPILASWTRSRLSEVRPDAVELPHEAPPERDTLLTRAAEPVLRAVADLFVTEPVSVILCDAAGVVLSRRTGDSGLDRHLDRVWLAPGFSYAEQYVGTNGIGTALEGRQPVQVFGHEHYVENLEQLACAGVPIRHPLSGKVLGVVDLTCWRRDAGPMMVATAGTLAHRVEQVLLEHAGRGELAVLNDYLVACKRSRGPVLAIGEDLLVMNDRAREALDPADQAPLLAEAREALVSGRRHPLLVDLPSGRTVRVHCRPTVGAGSIVGGVLDVQLVSRPVPTPGRPAAATLLPLAVGSSLVWRKCCESVARHLRTGEWLVLEGETGAGRETLAWAAHHARTPTGRLRVLRAEDHGPGWAAEVAEEVADGVGTLVLTDVDRLPAGAMTELVDVLEPLRESTEAHRPWVVATVSPLEGDPGPELTALLLCFPRTVQVPPLRRHIDDVVDLVPHLLGRLGRGGALSCSPEVVRVFLHNRWPGNVEQLFSVLRQVVARRRAGVIELEDLPATCWTTGKRVLTPLESLECDAIVQSLLDTRGNKVAAARRLSMSRATIYRKVRDYGIVVPGGA
ncbi:sigma-54-dependent Fis family transcriptional regulator [Geodermatophilus sp. CPCC 206100]|uniref:sigma-54-dependent Fis family transcriptional regulator n=1 Tax=Geodermatophilus sp. CPCC 206100 TaxID=3020054 RepID=UPI003B006EC7